jgi:hypothetical protein
MLITSKLLWRLFWKWRLVEIFQCRESIRDIIMYPHIKFWWYRKMLNFYRPYFMPCFGSHFENGRKRRIAPLMVTYHYVKFYVSTTLSDIIWIWYVGRLWCPEFIPDNEKFLAIAIFKMAATIPHKFNIVRFQRHFIVGRLWCPVYKILMISDNVEFCGHFLNVGTLEIFQRRE